MLCSWQAAGTAAPAPCGSSKQQPALRPRHAPWPGARIRRRQLHICILAIDQGTTGLDKAAVTLGPEALLQHQTVTTGLSYVHGRTDTPLLEETMGQCLDRTAKAHPDSLALVSVHQGVRLSYRDFHAHVTSAACGFLALGVQLGDRVAIWAPNRWEWAVAQWAAAKIGAILVNINPAYRAPELAFALNQAGVSVLILAPGLRGSTEFIEVAQSVQQQVASLARLVVLGEEAPPGWLRWSELLAAGADPRCAAELAQREAQVASTQPINIQYTSGTTGHPKAATLSHRNIVNNAAFIAHTCQYTHCDRICAPVPAFHCFGYVIANAAAVMSGAAVVYPAESFSASATLAAVQAERCTSLYGVPTMFIAELSLPSFQQYNLTSLRTGVMAGSPCPVTVMEQVRTRMHMRDVTICYGMTETSPVSFQTAPDDPTERRVSSVGRVHPHLEARVVDPVTGNTLQHGQVGELHVRGYSVMLGYWGDERSTRQAIDAEGWMHTGDLTTIDAEGYCNIVGRRSDMIIRGGENIYPREVEEFLHMHPGVADVQVFGVPSALYGEQVCAWVKLRDGHHHVGRAELRAWCKDKIARFKVPRHWRFVDSFPTTLSGKPQKYLMRAAMAAELGLENPKC